MTPPEAERRRERQAEHDAAVRRARDRAARFRRLERFRLIGPAQQARLAEADLAFVRHQRFALARMTCGIERKPERIGYRIAPVHDIAEARGTRPRFRKRKLEHYAKRAVIGMTIAERRHRDMRRCPA